MSINRIITKNKKPDQRRIVKKDGDVMAYRIQDENILRIIKNVYKQNTYSMNDDALLGLKEIIKSTYITSDDVSLLALLLKEDIENPQNYTDLGELDENLIDQIKISDTQHTLPGFDINDFDLDQESGPRVFIQRNVHPDLITLYEYLSEYFSVSRTSYGYTCFDKKDNHNIMYFIENLGEVA